jgi:hypothetical protein
MFSLFFVSDFKFGLQKSTVAIEHSVMHFCGIQGVCTEKVPESFVIFVMARTITYFLPDM